MSERDDLDRDQFQRFEQIETEIAALSNRRCVSAGSRRHGAYFWRLTNGKVPNIRKIGFLRSGLAGRSC
jgi:hypothetical protein